MPEEDEVLRLMRKIENKKSISILNFKIGRTLGVGSFSQVKQVFFKK